MAFQRSATTLLRGNAAARPICPESLNRASAGTFWFIPKQQIRRLSLHEYQSQSLLKEYHVPVPRGKVAHTAEDVEAVIKELGKPIPLVQHHPKLTACAGGSCVIKSQILKGGRGKGHFDSGLQGGIHVASSAQAGKDLAQQMLGHKLRTAQTGDDGLTVKQVYVAEKIAYEDEWYLAMTIDRENYTPAIIVSKNGGVDIESVAKDHPEKLHAFHFQLSTGITPELTAQISKRLGINQTESQNLESVLNGMHKIFVEKDATLLEINPLVRSAGGSLTCLDAKFSFDNAAEKRQKDLFALRDKEHEVVEEVEAEKYGLVYVRMEGNIGNVVNGAGLAMATNDAIGLHGGASANFLDAGGQATKETMQQAFGIIMRDERVKTIFVNIYGGITRCDMIAESIIGAASDLGPMKVPVVVRLQGTNSAEGLKMLEEADLGLHVEAGFGEAAKKAVELAKA